MVTVLKSGAGKRTIKLLLKKLRERSPKKGLDAYKYFGTVKFKEDAFNTFIVHQLIKMLKIVIFNTMEKIVLKIKDSSKLRLFLELLKQFDFVEVRKINFKTEYN